MNPGSVQMNSMMPLVVGDAGLPTTFRQRFWSTFWPALPFWGLGVFVCLLPFGFPFFTSIVLADFIMVPLLILSWPRWSAPLPRSRHTLDALFLVFFGFSCAGLDIARFPTSFVVELTSLVYGFLILRLTAGILVTKEAWRTVFRCFALSFTLLLTLLTLVMLLRAGGWDSLAAPFLSSAAKLCWPFRTSNQLGFMLIGGFPLACALFLRAGPALFGLYGAILLACGGTGSRIVLAVGITQIVALELAMTRRAATTGTSWRRWLRWILLGCTTLLVTLALARVASFQRALGYLPQAPMTISAERVSNLEDCLSLGETLLSGVGLGCFKRIFPHEVHNTVLSFLAETGIGGCLSLSLLILLAASPVLRALRANDPFLRRSAYLLALALGGLAIAGVFHNVSRNRLLWTLLGFATALDRVADGQGPVTSG